MHEHGPVSEAVGRLAELHAEGGVGHAELLIGPGIDPEVAGSVYRHLVEGTALEDVEVSWVRIADTLTCLTCFGDYPGARTDPCPACGGVGLVVEEAAEVAVGKVTA